MSDDTFDSDFYTICIPWKNPTAIESVGSVIEYGLEATWSTTREGDTAECIYSGQLTDDVPERMSIEDALADIEAVKRGSIQLFADTTDFTLRVCRTMQEYGLSDISGITLTWDRVHFRDTPEKTTNELFHVSQTIFERVPSPFAFSYLPYSHERSTVVTQTDLDTYRLPDVFWLMLLSEKVCSHLGRERVKTAPAWRITALAGGGLGVVSTANPFEYDEKTKQTIREYLHGNI